MTVRGHTLDTPLRTSPTSDDITVYTDDNIIYNIVTRKHKRNYDSSKKYLMDKYGKPQTVEYEGGTGHGFFTKGAIISMRITGKYVYISYTSLK